MRQEVAVVFLLNLLPVRYKISATLWVRDFVDLELLDIGGIKQKTEATWYWE